MPVDIERVSPRDVHQHYRRGRDRLKNFRDARLMFLRNYTGPYYDKALGKVGAEALNLIYHAVRNLLPNIAMNFPKHVVESRFLASRPYADLLGLALEYHDKEQRLDEKIRVGIVDAIFTLGIFKTLIGESDSLVTFDDDGDAIDPGQVVTDVVDFDNFVVDPDSMEHLFADAKWMGDIIRVPRMNLLDSGLYNNELVEQLPSVDDMVKNRRAKDLSRHGVRNPDTEFMDEVEIAELWVPGSNIMLTIPATADVSFDDYLRVDDYYGPKEGPYTLLSLSPPVPGNPLPVPQVGVWNDIHKLANEMAEKIIEQAKRQKDVVTYKPSAADDAEALRDAQDGEAIMTDDPDGVQVKSLGGQQASNEIHISQLTNWFNMMASNPQALAGERVDADSATEARILQGNANIGLEDAKGLVYKWVGREASKRAWYFHTDPLIEVPLIRRDQIPARFADGPFGPVMVEPSRLQEVQVFLTPEARRGDWLHFTFSIESESMGRKDQNTRFAEVMDFAVKIMPAALQAAEAAFRMGLPFNVKVYVERLARTRGITWMDEVWFDPEFQFRIQQMMLAGPSPVGSQGAAQQGNPANAQNPLAAILQNGQPGQVGAVPSQQKLANQESQLGANAAQSQLRSEGFG